MKKKLVAVLVLATLLLSISAHAAETRACAVMPSLTFNGTTAECHAVVSDPGKTIHATMELWYGGAILGSWSDSDINSVVLEGSKAVVSGKTYTLKVYGTSGGISFSDSISRACP